MRKRIGLIGYPIEHSLSPWIHRQFLTISNITGSYHLYEIRPEEFHRKIQDFIQSNIDGFNVTVPYKQKIIPYLDDLDANAKRIGAVNTVIQRAGKWIGYNTDGIGYVRSLRNAFPSLFNKKSSTSVLMLGAGGAARGIYFALSQSGFSQIDIANRTLENAYNLKHMVNTKTTIYTLEQAEKNLHLYDLIIQTTTVGMKPNTNHSIIQMDNIHNGCVVSDIVYQPLMTKFLKNAKDNGAKIHLGHMMLLYQAQAAFELWTNEKLDVKEMSSLLRNILEG